MGEMVFADEVDRIVTRLAELCESKGVTLATVESLTGGQLAAAVSAAPNAASWYRGGIVAYHPRVKYGLLETPRGSVVTAETAAVMARSAARLLDADFAVAVTGVGGPKPQEGKPAGTVYLATCAANEAPMIEHHQFDGESVEVMEQTVYAALAALLSLVSGVSSESS